MSRHVNRSLVVIIAALVLLGTVGGAALAQEKDTNGREAGPAAARKLIVNQSPLPAGAQFRVQTSGNETYDSGWMNSVSSWSRNFDADFLRPVSFTISFRALSGSDAANNYFVPGSKTGSLKYFGGTVTRSVTWISKNLTLTIKGRTNGGGSAPAGAQYRIVRTSGGTTQVVPWTALTPGNHPHSLLRDKSYRVEYALVPDFWKPFNDTVYLNYNKSATGNYKTQYHSIGNDGKIRVKATIDGSPGAPSGTQFRVIHGGGRYVSSWRILNSNGSEVVIGGLDFDIGGQSYTIEYTQNPTGHSGASTDTTKLRLLDHDNTVTAEYKRVSYTLNFVAGSGGGIAPPGSQSVKFGDDGTSVTATPNPSHNFVNWTKSGGGVVSTNPAFKPTNVQGNETYTANFALKTYTVTFNAGPNGTLFDGTVKKDTYTYTVPHGSDTTTVEAHPDSGYGFKNWTGSITSNAQSLVIPNVMSDMTVMANFERLFGTLKVNINPKTIGAKFSITGPGDFTPVVNQGTDYNQPVPVGQYTVTYSVVTDYTLAVSGNFGAINPASGTVGVEETKTVNGDYSRDTGTLDIKIINGSHPTYTLPKGTGPDQANWQITANPADYPPKPVIGSADLNDPTAPTGSYTVFGSAVPGWSRGVTVSQVANRASPSATSQTGQLAKNTALKFEITYQRLTGTVVINVVNGSSGEYPTLPGAAGWKINDHPAGYGGATNGNSSGLNSTGAPTGDYIVDGKTVPDWNYNVTVGSVGPSVAPQGTQGTLVYEGTLTFTVTYERQIGTLVIDIVNDSKSTYTLPGTAGWDLTNKPSDYPPAKPTEGFSDHSDSSAPAGNYAVNGKSVTGWTFNVAVSGGDSSAPAIPVLGKSGTLEEGGELKFTITYTRDVGTLIINVVNGSDPDYTLPGGAGWKLTDTPGDYPGSKPKNGNASGLNDPDAPTGEYTVTGKDVDHWRFSVTANALQQDAAPSDLSKTRTLEEGGQLTFTVTYSRNTGDLEIATGTFDGRNLPVGAGWDLTHDDPGDYIGLTTMSYVANETSPQVYSDGAAATGDYTLTGKPVVGWSFNVTVLSGEESEVAPSAETETETGTLERKAFLTFTIIYTINTYDVGAVYWDPVGNAEVPGGTITPGNAVVEHGASQGFTASTLPTDYELLGTVSFTGSSTSTSVAGDVATVNGVTSDGTVRIDVKLSLGELEVIILPESIRPQAGWKFQGGGAYKPSSPNPAGTEALVTGFYDLEFADVDGWFTPDPIKDIQVLPNQKRVVTVVYTEDPAGSLQIFIEDNFDERVNKLGAQWQPVFPAGSSMGAALADTWYNSGDIIAGIKPGDVGIRFKTLAGWVLPELGGATVVANKTTRETGEYYRVLVIHKSDYNGDGTDDLATFDKANGMWSVASIGKPAAIPGAVDLFEEKFGTSKDIPTAGDYDGDGVADLAYWREATGEWRVSRQFKLKNFGQMQDIPVPGDYNGDGMTNPALFRPSTGEWIIYNAETKKTTKVSFGAFGDVPVPGNYDADSNGMTDLAVFNVETRKWRVAIYDANKDAWVEKKMVKVNGKRIKLRVTHGAIGHVPVHADYDGDGATDLAVYARRGSEWNVRDQFEIQLGVRGDVPVPNDWAGLGRVIPTIFHPKNGRWVAIDNLLRTKHGRGGQPLMSGR